MTPVNPQDPKQPIMPITPIAPTSPTTQVPGRDLVQEGAEYAALGISLLETVLAGANLKGAAPAVIAGFQNAIAQLLAVHGTDVTYKQIQDL